MKEQPVLQVAAKAVIVNASGQVLVVRESASHTTNTQAGRYTLPGGRLEPGESYLDGLKREAREEVGLQVEPERPLYVGEWRPVIKGVPHQIIAIFMLCRAKEAEIRLSEEHDGFAWITPKDREQYELADPDWEVIDALAHHR